MSTNEESETSTGDWNPCLEHEVARQKQRIRQQICQGYLEPLSSKKKFQCPTNREIGTLGPGLEPGAMIVIANSIRGSKHSLFQKRRCIHDRTMGQCKTNRRSQGTQEETSKTGIHEEAPREENPDKEKVAARAKACGIRARRILK